MKTHLFQSCGHCRVFQILWHIECSTFTASSFRIWSSSTGIPSPPLALFVVMLSKAHLTSHSRRSGSRSVITPSWLTGSWRSFLYSSSVYSCHLFLISSASVRSIPFLSFIEPMFAWNVPLVSLIFLKRSLVFPILLFSSISLHWSLKKAFLSLLAILWNSAFRCLSLPFSSINIYVPNIGVPQYIRQMLTNLKGEIKSNAVIVGDFNIPLTRMYRSTKQKISKETQTSNDTMDQLDLIDIYRTPHPKQWISPFSQVHREHFQDRSHKSSFGKLEKENKNEIISSIISDHNAVRLDVVAQWAKNLPAMQGTQVRFLGWEDSLEKEMATNSSILAWRVPRTEEFGRLQSMGPQESETT